jgi:hypothetical protein
VDDLNITIHPASVLSFMPERPSQFPSLLNLLAPKFYFSHPVYKMQKTGPKKGKIMK